MASNLKKLIDLLIEAEFKGDFAPPPKMGDIDPTPEDDKDRPGMRRRPDDGMDVSQHHKMMHAEALTVGGVTTNQDSDSNPATRGFGDQEEEPINIVSKSKDKEAQEPLEEMSAISGGGAGMASSGKVSATSAGSAWKNNNPEHELMWSGDSPHSKRPASPNASKKKVKS